MPKDTGYKPTKRPTRPERERVGKARRSDASMERPTATPQERRSDASLRSPTANYLLRGAIVFLIAHTLFVVFVLAWGFERSMFIVRGGHFIFYLVQLPGVEFTKAIGQAESLEVMAPYMITFFTNTVFYCLLGCGAGYLVQRKGWVDDTDDIFLTEEEIEWKKLNPPE